MYCFFIFIQYRNSTLVIVYQDTTLTPTGDFYYSQTSSNIDNDNDHYGRHALFWIYVSVGGLLLVIILMLTLVIIVSYMLYCTSCACTTVGWL